MQKIAIILKDRLLPQYFKRRCVCVPTTRASIDLAQLGRRKLSKPRCCPSHSPDSEAVIHTFRSSHTNSTELSSVLSLRLKPLCTNGYSKHRMSRTSCVGTKSVIVIPRSRMSCIPIMQAERLTDLCPPSRHRCHYKMDLADIFRYMATFIKISNHLALILPGTHPVIHLVEVHS